MYALPNREAGEIDFEDLTSVLAELQAGHVILAGNHGGATPLIVNDHAHTTLGLENSLGYLRVTIRNPWGYNGGTSTFAEAQDGIIVMSWDDFVNTFEEVWVS